MTSTRRRNELPAWYHRVSGLTVFPDAEICPHYFDEDISDLDEDVSDLGENNDESDENVAEIDCDCDSDVDCECYAEDEEDMLNSDDSMSERSYDGSDADWYYELKDLREDRKKELRALAEEKQGARDYEVGKEEEVRVAYEALKKAEKEGETLYMDSLAGKEFRLYSADHLDHHPWYSNGWDVFSSKYVEFYCPEAGFDIPGRRGPKNSSRRTVEGHVYLDSAAGCNFLPFRSPTGPSREKLVLKSHDGKHSLRFQFISDEYLKLKVDRELVFDGHQGPVPESAPRVFEFMGILRNSAKEKE